MERKNEDFTIEARDLLRRVLDIDDQLIVHRDTLLKLLEEELYAAYSRGRMSAFYEQLETNRGGSCGA